MTSDPSHVFIHSIPDDHAVCVHSVSGRLLSVTRPPRKGPTGASVRDPQKFLNLHRIQEIELAQLTDARRESCEPWAALWLGMILGSSFVIVMGSLYLILR